MLFTKCDGCGKTYVPKEKITWRPDLVYFTKFDLCGDCNKIMEEQWEEAFHKCGHDMKVFTQKKIEIAKAMCTANAPARTTTTKKKR
jgi:hypothetical protein